MTSVGQSRVFPKGALHSVPPRERFWYYVNKGAPGGCWEWFGTLTRAGYGSFRIDGKLHLAHRLIYEWEVEGAPIPSTMFVCHHCDNPPCVNPAHLFKGTHSQNMQDSLRKNRASTGERHYKARISDAVVAEIRARYAAGDTNKRSLAKRYGVSESNVRDWVTGRSRKAAR